MRLGFLSCIAGVVTTSGSGVLGAELGRGMRIFDGAGAVGNGAAGVVVVVLVEGWGVDCAGVVPQGNRWSRHGSRASLMIFDGLVELELSWCGKGRLGGLKGPVVRVEVGGCNSRFFRMSGAICFVRILPVFLALRMP